MNQNIIIVLTRTSHPGNIGATARAMKNMGLKQLYLVAPKEFPCAEATARASGASDILEHAKVYTTLAEALENCERVYATSARARTLNWAPLMASTACEQILKDSARTTAIVFGNERSGLTNDELNLAHHQIVIPTDAAYSSLNLSQAVQVVCYELFKQWQLQDNQNNLTALAVDSTPAASLAQLQNYMSRLEILLKEVEFLKPPHTMLMKRIRRIYNRAKLDENEINILQGMVSAINRAIDKKSQS